MVVSQSVAQALRSPRSRLAGCALLLALSGTGEAAARQCGDDLDGVRISCACGDTVVVDTTLVPGDPIVAGRCPLDGLIIESRPLAETLVLDLNGLAIVGSGAGVGIRVDNGGSEGAVVVGGSDGQRGEVVGFNVGILVHRAEAIRRIASIALKGNRHEGLDVRSAGTMIVGVRAERNGSDGLRLNGRGGRMLDVESVENGGAGIRAYGFDLIIDARATGNARHGIISSGYRSDLGTSVAVRNRGYGVLLSGTGHRVDHVRTEDNTIGGLAYRNRVSK